MCYFREYHFVTGNRDESSDSDDSSNNWAYADDYVENKFLLAKSPPIPRQRIREKEKSKNLRLLVNKDFSFVEKKQTMNSGETNNASNSFSSPNSSSSDLTKPNLSHRKRHEGARSLKTLRRHDRDEKHFAPSLVMHEQGQHKPSSLEYESSNRFLSLDSKPSIRKNATSFTNSLSSQLLSRKNASVKESECPKERLEFFNTFSMLINLGSTKREKPKETKLVPYTRQGSTEQELWTNQCSDLIWLGLQAYLSDRTLNQEDEHLYEQRDVVASVIYEITTFKAKPRDIEAQNNSGMCWLQERVQDQFSALQQVSELLTRLDAVESLYPTRRALGRQHSSYLAEEFRLRLDALQLWMNIVQELNYKLEVMAQVLLVDSLQIVCWPGCSNDHHKLHVVCSRYSSCAVNFSFTEDEDNDSYCSLEDLGALSVGTDDHPVRSSIKNREEGSSHSIQIDDRKKNVHFNVSELSSPMSSSPDNHDIGLVHDASTPMKPTPGRPLGTFSSGSSSAVFDLNSRTSVYRHFVERSLKRSGMRKLLLLLKDLLESTLLRTRQALIGCIENDSDYGEQHVWKALGREVDIFRK